jgi:ubiquinone/menaquinone biosynthesis C-methylase UbiE
MQKQTAVFDHVAKAYDQLFTNSHTGRLQRKKVWQYLERKAFKSAPLHILELNCGTGEDALFMANKGHRVIATDLSPEMIKVAQSKQEVNQFQGQLTFETRAIEDISTVNTEKFDLVFSNFGGLNCIAPEQLQDLFHNLSKLLKPNGRFIAVIMPRFCLQESLYFLLKFQFDKVLRRRKKTALKANVSGKLQNTWYYNPIELKRLAGSQFQQSGLQPIGFFLPPSYLEPTVHSKKVLLKTLNQLEGLIKPMNWLAPASDHYLIDLEFVA